MTAAKLYTPERLPDWEERLAEYLASCVGAVFRWGDEDCALFSARAVEAMTGEHPAKAYVGRYSSQTTARDALRDNGDKTLLGALRNRFEQVSVGTAQRGDLAWNGQAVGVIVGDAALFIGEADGAPGLVRVPRAMWKRAFAVGRAA